MGQDTILLDSLENLLKGDLSNIERVEVLNELAFQYVNYDSAKTLSYANESIIISDEIKYVEGEADAMIQIAWAYFRSGNLREAFDQFREAYALSENINDSLNLANIFHGMGTVLVDLGEFSKSDSLLNRSLDIHQSIRNEPGEALAYNQLGILKAYKGDYSACLDYFLKALVIQERLNNRTKLSGNYNNIAIVYQNLNENEKALEYFLKSMKINTENNDLRGLAINYNNILPIYESLGREEEAYQLNIKAMNIYQAIGNKHGYGNSLNNLGEYHLVHHRYDSALHYFHNALSLRKQLDNPGEQTQSLTSLAKAYLAKGQSSKALIFLFKAKKIALNVGLGEDYKNILELLAETYRVSGNFEKAFEYHVLFKEMTDSILNTNKKQEVIGLEEKYEFQKQKDSIQYVRDMDKLQFDQEIVDRKSRESSLLFSAALLIVTLIAISILYYNKQQSNKALKKLNVEILKQKENLEQINESKSKLFSIISHDIKSPLSVIVGFSEVLVKHVETEYAEYAKDDEEIETIKTNMKEGKDRLISLLDDLMTWARSESGTMPYRPQKMLAEEVIKKSAENVTLQALAKKIELNMKIDSGLTLYGDANTFKVIFRNLLSNAIKFTKKMGNVSIEATSGKNQNVIQVSDTGIGIPEESIGSIFGYGKDKVRYGTSGEKGVGLGLSVVKEFVHMNGGSISVKSKVDEGTTFTILFPKPDE